MFIQHNQESLCASNAYNKTLKSRDKSMKQLSSGYRINSSADDAAGLSISQKMRYQIRGLDRANKNIGEGIDLVRIGDGGMNEIHAMLHRMKELSVYAATDTNTESERAGIKQEIDSLTDEIDKIAAETNYNGIYMLNGSEKATTAPGPGGGVGPVIGGGIAEALAKRTTYGGSGDDTLNDIIFEDDNVVFCGYTKSTDKDLDGTGSFDGKTDGWVTKLDENGEIVWTTKIGSGNSKGETLQGITKTQDGGYLAGGNRDGKAYMVKLDADGNIEWDYAFQSSGNQSNVNAVKLMQDGSGNVFISIQTFDYSGILDGNGNPLGGNSLGGRDTIIMAIDPTKNPNTDYSAFEVNAYRLGGSSNEQISKIFQTSDGGYIGGNYTTSGTIIQSSPSGTVTPPQTTIGSGHHHAYIVKFDVSGNAEKVLKFGDNDTPGAGGNSGENISRIIETSDGGYIVVGFAAITDTTGSAAPNTDHSSANNIWAMKLDHDLNPVWSRTYGSSIGDTGSSIIETADGYVIAGQVGTIDEDVTPKSGYSGNSAWIFKVDKLTGDIIWNEVHGGANVDGFTDMFQTSDGDILLAGNSSSNNADLDGKNKGGRDAWFLRISAATGETMDPPGGGGSTGPHHSGEDILLQVGYRSYEKFVIERADMRAKTLFGDPVVLDMHSHEAAGASIVKIDRALEYVSSQRSKYGSYENALLALTGKNAVTSENTSRAESKIADADVASVMVRFSELNILSQIGESMLAQANSGKQNVLNLLL